MNKPILKMLLDFGADPNINNNNLNHSNVFNYVTNENRGALLKMFMNYGLKINKKNKNRKSFI